MADCTHPNTTDVPDTPAVCMECGVYLHDNEPAFKNIPVSRMFSGITIRNGFQYDDSIVINNLFFEISNNTSYRRRYRRMILYCVFTLLESRLQICEKTIIQFSYKY